MGRRARLGARGAVGALVRPAFSLVELMIVVTIIAVAARIAIPRYGEALARYRVEAAAKRIATDLAMARADARATSTKRTVTFRPASATYEIDGVATLDRRAGVYTCLLGAEPYKAAIASATFGGDALVVFDGYGTPDTEGTVVVQVGKTERTVTVDGATGATSIK